ncbi:MAG: MmgE/PrpD family protein [Planctomycetia bacterium]|nr:MmgE/PrpD family protein [Planctomycetia bacterium]
MSKEIRNPKSEIRNGSTLSERLAEYAFNLSFEQLDERTVHEVRRRLIDSFACALGAWDAHAPNVARAICRRVTSEPAATFLGGSRKTLPALAAFCNGVLFRYLDFNDTYLSLEPAHPSDNLAAVLAAGEAAGRSGREIIAAAVLAYEIQCRFCDAASIRKHGWDHVTYGAFSTSAAAAKLFGLDAGKIEQALNLAGTPNITLRQTRAGELSEWKGCAFANASRNGVFAAMLASEGLTGPAPIFEGEMGFFKQVSGPFQPAKLGGEIAGDHDFMINKTSIKFWPAEYHSQSSIHAALDLRKQIRDMSQIKSFDIHSFDAAVDIIGKDPEKWRPKTRETADHSLPYCTAVALMDGDVTLDSFSDQRLRDEQLLALVAKIKVHRDPALTARYPRGIPNRLELTMNDGTRLVAENEFPRGHDQNPMTDAEVESKFHLMAAGRIDAAHEKKILDLCWRLDELPDVGELLGCFATVASKP